MSANLFFIICPHIDTRCYPWRRSPLCVGVGAFLLLLLPLFVVLFSPGFSFAQSTLTVVDNEPADPAPGEPGPGDNMVFAVHRDGTVEERGDTLAGAFLTDIEANKDGLFAATVNTNGPGPADDRDEVRVYRITEGTTLTLDASAQTDGVPPSFNQISTGPGRGSTNRHVIVSESQSGFLRSLAYNYLRL